MADDKRPAQPRDRRRDVEVLAADIFARRVANLAHTGRTPESVAADSLNLARAFYRACDEQPPPG